MIPGARLVVALVGVPAIAAVALAAAAEAQPPEPCPEGQVLCGDPSFPPPPQTIPDPPQPGGTGGESGAGAASTSPPPTASSGASSAGGAYWWLPEAAPVAQDYSSQAAYEYWLSQCSDDAQVATETYQDRDLAALRDAFQNPDWSCGDGSNSEASILYESLGGGGNWGRAGIETSNYDIGGDEGAANHITRKIWLLLTNMMFTVSKVVTTWAISILEWAFGFNLASWATDEVASIAIGYYGGLIPIYDLALFVALFFFAIQLMRGRTTAAISELGLTYAVYALFLVAGLATESGYIGVMRSAMETTGNLAGSVAAVTLQDERVEGCPAVGAPDPSNPGATTGMEAVVCPMARTLHAAFVERPYDLINWGHDLGLATDPNPEVAACALVRDQILVEGPWGYSDDPRYLMGLAGCKPESDFNHDPSADRFILALVTAGAAVFVLGIAVLSALTLIAAQILLIGLILMLPWILISGLLPGSGRSMLWRWFSGFARVVLVVMATAAFLSLYVVAIGLMIEATADESWLIQIGSLILVSATSLWVRHKLIKGSKSVASQFGPRLAEAVPGKAGGFFPSRGQGGAAALSAPAPALAASRTGAAASNGSGPSSNVRLLKPWESLVSPRTAQAIADARESHHNVIHARRHHAERKAIRRGDRGDWNRKPPRALTARGRAIKDDRRLMKVNIARAKTARTARKGGPEPMKVTRARFGWRRGRKIARRERRAAEAAK